MSHLSRRAVARSGATWADPARRYQSKRDHPTLKLLTGLKSKLKLSKQRHARVLGGSKGQGLPATRMRGSSTDEDEDEDDEVSNTRGGDGRYGRYWEGSLPGSSLCLAVGFRRLG